MVKELINAIKKPIFWFGVWVGISIGILIGGIIATI